MFANVHQTRCHSSSLVSVPDSISERQGSQEKGSESASHKKSGVGKLGQADRFDHLKSRYSIARSELGLLTGMTQSIKIPIVRRLGIDTGSPR